MTVYINMKLDRPKMYLCPKFDRSTPDHVGGRPKKQTQSDLSEGIQHTMTCFCCCLHTSPTVSWLQFINICKDNMLTQSWQQSGQALCPQPLYHIMMKKQWCSIVTLYPSFLLIHISTVETFSHFTKKLLLWKTKNITSLLWFVSVCGHVGSFFNVNCNYVNLGSCWWVTLKRCNKHCFSEQMSDVMHKALKKEIKCHTESFSGNDKTLLIQNNLDLLHLNFRARMIVALTLFLSSSSVSNPSWGHINSTLCSQLTTETTANKPYPGHLMACFQSLPRHHFIYLPHKSKTKVGQKQKTDFIPSTRAQTVLATDQKQRSVCLYHQLTF